MRKFRFRLERLLDYRRKQEDVATLALASARERELEAQRALEDLEADLRALDAERLRAQQDDSWLDVLAIVGASSRVAVQVEHARAALAEAELVTEERRLDAVARMTDRKVVDKLRQKARAAHYAGALSEEQKESDDISTTRYGKEV